MFEYQGKVLLIVNTATGCGFTPHYDPLFAYLATEKPFEGFGKGPKNAFLDKFSKRNNKTFGDKAYIKWNFTKFLIDREGNVVARFEPTVDMEDVKKAVAAQLLRSAFFQSSCHPIRMILNGDILWNKRNKTTC